MSFLAFRVNPEYDAYNNLTQFEYDKNNRLITTINPENHTTSQTYDDAGSIWTKTDGRNNTTTYEYDQYNRLVTITNAKAEDTTYTYDLNGNMLTQTDGEGNVTTYEYNVRNMPVKRIDHGGRTGSQGSYTYNPAKVETYTYHADGTLHTRTDRNGQTTTRLNGQTTETAVYTYDNNGNQVSVQNTPYIEGIAQTPGYYAKNFNTFLGFEKEVCCYIMKKILRIRLV